MEFRLTSVGSSLGFILPKDAQAHMRISKGDKVHVTEAPGGGYLLTPYDPEFADQMTRAERLMRKHRDVLRALAR